MLTHNKVSDILHSGDMFLLLFGLICHYVFFVSCYFTVVEVIFALECL